MGVAEPATEIRRRSEAHVHRSGRRVAELRPEVAPLGIEFLDDRGRDAKPRVQFLERVVVDQVELDVLVASALTRGGIGAAEQVELGAPTLVACWFDGFLDGYGLGSGFRLGGRSGLRCGA